MSDIWSFFKWDNLLILVGIVICMNLAYRFGSANITSYNGWSSIKEGFTNTSTNMDASEMKMSAGLDNTPEQQRMKDGIIMIQKASQDISNMLSIKHNKKTYEEILLAVDENISLVMLRHLILHSKEIANDLTGDKLDNKSVKPLNDLFALKSVIGDALKYMDKRS